MKQIAEYDLDGYAIGGLAVGEPAEVMYDIISAVEPFAPQKQNPLSDGRRHAWQHH